MLSTAAKEKLLQSQLEQEDEDEEEQYDIADLAIQANQAELNAQKGVKPSKQL